MWGAVMSPVPPEGGKKWAPSILLSLSGGLFLAMPRFRFVCDPWRLAMENLPKCFAM
jgi:hypothetical protein